MRDAPRIEVAVQPEGSPKVRVDMSDRVISLEYEDCENKADKLSLTVDNYDLKNFDDPIWRKGNRLHVSWGYPEAMAITRVCQIRKVVGFRELKIEALGREIELNVEHKCRTFEGMSRSDVALMIAQEWGYRDEELLHIEHTKVTREHIVQARQTDAQLLRRLARKEGFEWWIDHDGFHFHQRNLTQRTVRVLTWFEDPDASDIQDITIENDVTKRPGSVNMRSHSPTHRRTIDVEATNLTEKQRAALGYVVDAPGKTEKSTPGFASIAHHVTKGTTEPDDATAQKHAAAVLRRAQQTAVKMEFTMAGDPNIQAKSVIEVRGIGKRLSQRYYVRSVTHSISGAYTTKVKCVSDGTGGHSTKSTLAHEASAVQVGPKIEGRKGPPAARRTIDIDPKPVSPPNPANPAAKEPRPLVPVPKPDGSVGFSPTAPGVPEQTQSEDPSLLLMSRAPVANESIES